MPFADPQSRKRWRLAHYLKNREHILDQVRAYREKNRDLVKLKFSAFREANRERLNEAQKEYYLRNKEAIRGRQNLRFRDRYANDPTFRASVRCRNRMKKALGRLSKIGKSSELLGCSPGHLKVWLTFYFQPGMTWANYGKVWHIDHTKPCVAFDLSDPAQQRECFHYTNLQPMFASENRRKGATWAA